MIERVPPPVPPKLEAILSQPGWEYDPGWAENGGYYYASDVKERDDFPAYTDNIRVKNVNGRWELDEFLVDGWMSSTELQRFAAFIQSLHLACKEQAE